MIVLGTLVLLLCGVVPAAAFWSSTGASADTIATGTLDPPSAVTVPAHSSSTLTVSWTPPLALPAPTGYYVQRVGSGTAPACGSSLAVPVVGTSCVDSGVPDGTYSYVVTSVYRSWTAASAPSGGVVVAKPVGLALTTQPSNTIAGEDINPPVAVALRSAAGTAAPQSGVPITLSFGANPAGGVLAGTLTELTDNAGVALFADVSINRAGAGYTLAAKSAGLTVASSSAFSITAAPSFKFVFTTAPVTGIATNTASRGPLTIQSQDVFDNPTNAPAGGTVVSLSSSSTGTKIFASTSGGVSIGTVTIPAGASSVSFYYGDTLAGNPQISASRTGFSTGRQTQTITAAAPSKFAFTSAPITGSASLVPTLGPLTVQLTDTFGNLAVATASTTAAMASSSTATKRFSLSPTGTPTTTSLIFAVGTSAASFYYSDSKAGTPTITISRSGYTSATQVQTILATAATKLAITSTAITLAAPSTTASRGPFTVQLQDANGNPVLAPVGGRTVALTSSSTSTTKVLSATLSGTPTTTVTIPAGASTTTFYYGDTKAGSATISVSSSGLTTGTQATTTAAGPVTQLAFTSTAITGAASTTAARGPFTVQSRDQYGNASVAPTGGIVVSLSSASTGATVFAATASGTATSSVTIAAAASSVSFYYGDTKAGTAAITARSPGLTSATQNVTITGTTPAALVFSTAAVTGAASSTAARGPYTAQLRDVFGNVAVAPTGGTVISLSSNSTGTRIFSATANGAAVTTRTIAATASTVSFYYGDTKVGTPTITVTAGGLTGASQITTITPATPTVLAITTAAVSGAASATASLGPITVQLRDAFGNTATAPVAGTTLTLGSTSTGAKVFSTTVGGTAITTVTIPSGASTATLYYGDTKTGTPIITVSGTGLTSATQTATITGAGPTATVFSTTALTGPASATASMGPLTVQLRDAFGNTAVAPTGGTSIALTSTSTGVKVFSASPGGTAVTTVAVGSGTSSVSFYYGDTKTGTPTITAAATGLTSATQNQTITAAAVGQLLITSAALSGTASSTASLGPVTVQAKDQFGNLAIAPVGGTTLTLSSSSTGTKIFAASLNGTSVTTATIPSGASSTTFYYGDTLAGAPMITVSLAGATSAAQAATIQPAAATKLGFGQQPPSAARGATLIPAVTARILDQFNNLTTSTASVTIAIGTNPVGGTLNGTKVVTAAAGVATFSTLNITAPASGTGYTLQITATGVTAATSTGFTIS